MLYEKQYLLVDRLISQTNAGQITWKESFSDEAYEVQLGEYKVVLKRDIDSDGDEYFNIDLIDRYGTTLETMSSYQLNFYQHQYRISSEPYGQQLKDLYQKIRRVVLGVEKAVDEILKHLG